MIGKDKVFTFDHVLAPKISQQELYEQCVRPLVHNVFEGYNATVFAYGQTVMRSKEEWSIQLVENVVYILYVYVHDL